MNEKEFEILNTGVLKPEFVKNATHFFCRAVIHECEDDVCTGYRRLVDNLIPFSQAHTETQQVKPICYGDDLLDIFFNQQNTVPMYVYFWLLRYYGCTYGEPAEYTERHYDVYGQLLQLKVECRRFQKQDDLDLMRYEKSRRRIICKAFASGDYSTTFKMTNKDFNSFINTKELETISVMLNELFHEQFNKLESPDEMCAAAYMLGIIQGKAYSHLTETYSPINTAYSLDDKYFNEAINKYKEKRGTI